MVRRFKLKFLMHSFQFCGSMKTSVLAKSPKHSKKFDIPYPDLPSPPPSTPITLYPFCNQSDFGLNPSHHMTYNSPVSDFSDDIMRPIARPKADMDTKHGRKHRTKAKHRLSISISSGESGWFSSEEAESLFSSSPSFESSFDLDYPMNHLNGTTIRKKKNNNLKVRRLKHYLLSSFKDTEAAIPEHGSVVKKSVFERLMPCMVEGPVTDSFAVVKKSADPYDDFKRSMMEMILEKQIFEVKELEQLLLCFLSLNSQHHHAVIVAAFTEIWEEIFTTFPVPQVRRL